MKVRLIPKIKPTTSIEAEVITPDAFAGKKLEEIVNLPVWEGKIRRKLGDFFDVEGETLEKPEDLKIVIEGDASRIKYIGARMTAGEILIKGNVDMHMGDEMQGGRIIVEGNADSFTALSMRGGEIIIKGSVKNYLGSAPRGEWRGMRGGRIIVEGSAGREVGSWMMGGLIRVKGNIGPFAGVHMKGGTIIVEGDAEARIGAQMTGGIIIILGKLEEMLPGFSYKETVDSVNVDGEKIKGPFLKFVGDLAEDGEGSLLISSEKNQHLL
ncbi:MAG: formylmethanofuran dehydrogenase subunit C [Nitrososphaerota archaeon]|nr:formylmethanofuran dehydrogenase subunit C [Candidatus Bathyarchaeota archaeon]MDW8022733.1 formylmethanofuran dehydrogenase subunit C [Nitrososphaerota archaeon]